MTTPSSEPSSNDSLDLAISLFLDAESRGETPDRSAILAEYPSIASRLLSFFADHDRMRSFASPLEDDATGPNPFLAPTGTHHGSSLLRNTPRLRLKYVGDYELIDEIATGGMGVVYLARQITLNRIVAVKMILSGVLADADSLRRFRQEAESAAALDHPNIVPIYEVGEHESQPYFSMKLIDGPNLADVLSRDSRPPRRDLVRLLMTVALAVDHAHRRGVLHRDLKPRNILLDPSGSPHVTDFGLARRLESDSDLTATGGTPGTPSYMAPEQARGVRKPTVGVDVYGLGAILYEILTGRPPHRADSPLETLRLVIDAEPVAPRELDPTVDRDLETIALKCLEKDPGRRYGSAQALVEELDRWLEGRPILARPVGKAEKSWRWCKRNPALSTAGGMAALGLLIATTMSVAFALQSRSRALAEKDRADIAMKAEKAADSARDSMEGLLARGLAKSLDPEGDSKFSLSTSEAESLWELTGSEDRELGPRFVSEAIRSSILFTQLYGRSEPAMIAAIGLDQTMRDKTTKLLDYNTLDSSPRSADCGRMAIIALELADANSPFATRLRNVLRDSLRPSKSDPNAWFYFVLNSTSGNTNAPYGLHWRGLRSHLLPIDLAAVLIDLMTVDMDDQKRIALAAGFNEIMTTVEPATATPLYLEAMKAEMNVYSLSELASGLTDAVTRMPVQEASPYLKRAVDIFEQRSRHANREVEKVALMRGLGEMTALMPPEIGVKVSYGPTRFIMDKLLGSTDVNIRKRSCRALASIARRLKPSDAVRLLTDAIANEACFLDQEPDTSDNLSILSYGLSSVMKRIDQPEVAVPLAETARIIVRALEQATGDANRDDLSATLAAISILMSTDDAIRILGDARRRQFRVYCREDLARGLASVAERMEPDAAATLLNEAIHEETKSGPLRALAMGLERVAARMRPVEGAHHLDEAAKVLVDAMRRDAIDEVELQRLAEVTASLAGRMNPVDSARVLRDATRILQGAMERSPGYERRYLVTGLAAVASRMTPEDGMRILSEGMRRESTQECLYPLASGFASVAMRAESEDVGKMCRSMLRSLAIASSERIGLNGAGSASSLQWVLSALLSQIDVTTAHSLAREATTEVCATLDLNEDRDSLEMLDSLLRDDSRRERAYRDAMFDLAWSTGGPIAAEMVLDEPYPCRLTDQELVELLKMPTCFGPARMVVLKHLGNRHGREFKHHWEFVRFARENGLKLDFTTPPKRPDPKESLKRMIEALERKP